MVDLTNAFTFVLRCKLNTRQPVMASRPVPDSFFLLCPPPSPGCANQAGGQGRAPPHGGEGTLVPQPADGVLRCRPNRCPTARRRLPGVRVEPGGGVLHRGYDTPMPDSQSNVL